MGFSFCTGWAPLTGFRSSAWQLLSRSSSPLSVRSALSEADQQVP